jgi:RNA polymerase-associated protein LEO1
MYLTKIPKFLSIDPRRWHHTTYQPPTTDHHSHEAAPGFSAYSTATSTVHWRRSPSNPKKMQSNARILRWSDGSLTLQLASNPTQQYEIEGNPLAPRQRNPSKPTPTSQKPGRKDHSNDSYTYLTVPDPSNGLLRVTHKITAGLSILPSAATTDDALEKLQNSLAAISQGKNKSQTGGIEFVKIDEDPELAKKKAEVAEREKDRARKRREAAETRERERNGRAMGRAGLGSRGYGGGLTAGMLENDELGGGGGGRQ